MISKEYKYRPSTKLIQSISFISIHQAVFQSVDCSDMGNFKPFCSKDSNELLRVVAISSCDLIFVSSTRLSFHLSRVCTLQPRTLACPNLWSTYESPVREWLEQQSSCLKVVSLKPTSGNFVLAKLFIRMKGSWTFLCPQLVCHSI